MVCGLFCFAVRVQHAGAGLAGSTGSIWLAGSTGRFDPCKAPAGSAGEPFVSRLRRAERLLNCASPPPANGRGRACFTCFSPAKTLPSPVQTAFRTGRPLPESFRPRLFPAGGTRWWPADYSENSAEGWDAALWDIAG
ncbi:hypothetical protein SDC9_105538 [bioreactor metagenome]|uniref:Uncharacterized protein n=1 Tax=bioreactor metagenome TaxID=1076179 RepID=A0A645AZQ9_9ZZZZ